MGTTRTEYEIALILHRREQKELQAQVCRMFGASSDPGKPLKAMRRKMAMRLDGISVSRMIIGARQALRERTLCAS